MILYHFIRDSRLFLVKISFVLGADNLRKFARKVGREDMLHILKLDVTNDDSVHNAKVKNLIVFRSFV